MNQQDEQKKRERKPKKDKLERQCQFSITAEEAEPLDYFLRNRKSLSPSFILRKMYNFALDIGFKIEDLDK